MRHIKCQMAPVLTKIETFRVSQLLIFTSENTWIESRTSKQRTSLRSVNEDDVPGTRVSGERHSAEERHSDEASAFLTAPGTEAAGSANRHTRRQSPESPRCPAGGRTRRREENLSAVSALFWSNIGGKMAVASGFPAMSRGWVQS